MRKMKNSGIEWIGEIPEDWEILKAKQIFKQRNSKGNVVEVQLAATQKYGMYPQKLLEGVVQVKEDTDLQQFKTVHKNDYVISLRSFQGGFEMSDYEGVCSPAYQVFYNTRKIEYKYFKYLFKCDGFISKMNSLTVGIREGKNIQYKDFAGNFLPVPPLTSQLSLITFLEKKCSEIDSVISKTRETIEEYKKLKQSIITEVVTGKVKIENEKACGKYDTYKDSGIEWIGEIPSEWEVKPIKALFSFGKGLPITKDNLTETGLSVISYGQIHSKNNIGTEIRNELIRYVDKIYYETNPQSLVHKGDFIFADTSEDLEGCGNFVYVNREEVLFAGYHTIILFSKEKNDNKYLAYLFQTDCWRRQISCCCSGVKLFSISRRILGSTNLILPSILEQQQISDFLDKKCSEIDKLITKKEQLVVELESYKKSLIYEVVTGKKES